MINKFMMFMERWLLLEYTVLMVLCFLGGYKYKGGYWLGAIIITASIVWGMKR